MPEPSILPIDRQLVDTWVDAQGSALTRKSYRHQGDRLLAGLGKPIAAATLADLQAFVTGLGDLAPATIGLAVSAVKSLYTSGSRRARSRRTRPRSCRRRPSRTCWPSASSRKTTYNYAG